LSVGFVSGEGNEEKRKRVIILFLFKTSIEYIN